MIKHLKPRTKREIIIVQICEFFPKFIKNTKLFMIKWFLFKPLYKLEILIIGRYYVGYKSPNFYRFRWLHKLNYKIVKMLLV